MPHAALSLLQNSLVCYFWMEQGWHTGLWQRIRMLHFQILHGFVMFFILEGRKLEHCFGEAVVFTKNNTPKNFVTRIKQHGALLAKGRLLGVQFDTLFSNDLYKRIRKHTINLSEKLKNILHEKNYRFYLESPTNQQFIIIENTKMEELAKNVSFSFWEKYDENHTVIRFVTSWATTEKDLDELIKLL